MTTIEDLVDLPPEGSGVVIAGPGTGKTHRIGDRIASLQAKDVNLDDIVVMTLTNETVTSLRKAVADCAYSDGRDAWAQGTLALRPARGRPCR